MCLSLLLAACAGPSRPPLRVDPQPGVAFSEPYLPPLEGGRVISPFGVRGGRQHTGVDLKGKAAGGDPVRAARAGRVAFAGRMRGYGNIVAIRHNDHWTSRYAHLRRIHVRLGQSVRRGQKIGTVGATGRTTGPHLHFEIITPDGRFVDPLPLIR